MKQKVGLCILITGTHRSSWHSGCGLWEKKCWRFCGSIVPTTDKAAREVNDVPFHKLSKGALNSIYHGWFWEGVLEKSFERSKYCVQCTTWKDRKQVMFLHTSFVGSSRGKHTVCRGKKGKHGQDNFAAVDHNDHDSADYTTSLHTNRWYLCVIMFWLLDRVIHTCYAIVCVKARNGEGPKEWQLYLKLIWVSLYSIMPSPQSGQIWMVRGLVGFDKLLSFHVTAQSVSFL